MAPNIDLTYHRLCFIQIKSEDLAIPVETLPSSSMVVMYIMHTLYIHFSAKENYFYPVEGHINLIRLRMDGRFLN